MDDFVAKIEEKLEEHTIRFLKIVKKYNLHFKQSKCNFSATKIPLLGVWVGNREVQMKEKKIKTVKE